MINKLIEDIIMVLLRKQHRTMIIVTHTGWRWRERYTLTYIYTVISDNNDHTGTKQSSNHNDSDIANTDCNNNITIVLL